MYQYKCEMAYFTMTCKMYFLHMNLYILNVVGWLKMSFKLCFSKLLYDGNCYMTFPLYLLVWILLFIL